jgi:hypothetical protein
MNLDLTFFKAMSFKAISVSVFCLCLQMPGQVLAKTFDADANPNATANSNNDAHQKAADQYLEALKAMNEKRHADAKLLLEKLIADQPQHAGALLDLAIMQCTLGNKAEAERLFAYLITHFAPPPAIVEIIDLHRKTGCTVNTPGVAVNFVAERGYDSNANQGASNSIFTIDDFGTPVNLELLPEYLPKPDHYMSASLDLSRDFGRYDGNMFLQLRARQYDTLSNLNSVGLAAGVENKFLINDWTIQPTASVSVMTLDHSLYQKQMGLRLKLTTPDKPDAWLKYSAVAGLSRVVYPTIKNFDGNTFELRGIASKLTDQYYVNLSATLMRDIGNEKRLGGDRHGWSVGGFLRTSIPMQIIERPLYAEIGWQRANWQSQKIYLAGLIDVKKHQVNSVFRTSLGFPVSQHSSIQIEYRRILNRENISFLSFDSKQYQISWQWQR